jgi:RNA polymerase sigma-70 factor (ECF subfamily)
MTTKQRIQQREILTVAHHDYENKLNLYAFFKIHDKTISEDLVQDTFKKTWIYLVRGGKIEIMKAFLYNILNNLIVDEYRKRKTVSLNILLEKGFEPIAGDFRRFLDILDGKAAFLLIEQLPKKYKKIMQMRYIQDLSLSEMALATGQSKKTIAVQLHRGLVKLRSLYNTM